MANAIDIIFCTLIGHVNY